MPSCEDQSRETGALCLTGSAHCLGWSGRLRHAGEPEALPDPALLCGLILFSSASRAPGMGSGAESGQRRASNLCFTCFT